LNKTCKENFGIFLQSEGTDVRKQKLQVNHR